MMDSSMNRIVPTLDRWVKTEDNGEDGKGEKDIAQLSAYLPRKVCPSAYRP